MFFYKSYLICLPLFQNMGRFSALPTQNELAEMKEDLAFKEGEMKKSEYTALGLASGEFS